jgi:tripartite-type tricarboxylate transporter receptor subunit TctC
LRLIIPFAVGGSTDILARICSQILTQSLGKAVIPENITGAGGVIGAQRVLSAPADGYMLLAGTPGPITINPLLLANISYDAAKDFRGIVLVGESPVVVVVNRESPIQSLQQLIAAAKAAPGKLTYASAGVGSFAHLSGELFNWRAGVKMTHVPYRGTAPAATDLMGGRADVMFENYPSVQSYLVGNQMRALAVGTLKPTSLLPSVPTVAGSGVPEYESTSWFGLFARTGTPQTAIGAINTAINAGLAEKSVQQQLARLGVEPVGGTPEAFDRYIAAKLEETRQLVKASGIKLE